MSEFFRRPALPSRVLDRPSLENAYRCTVTEEALVKLLVIGGTRFIGRHVVEKALADGHDVTLFHRSQSAHDLFPSAHHVLGDRNEGFTNLHGEWDATIDMCAYFPRQVNELADQLGERAGHYTLISSVSAYGSPLTPGFDESAPLAELSDPTVEEVTGETYGGLKVLCEQAAVDRFARVLIVRPTYVVGPHDLSWRMPWWVMTIADGGAVLAPGPETSPMQVIDARDLANWLVAMSTRGSTGVFHAVGPATPITWGGLLTAIIAEVGPPGTELVWVPAEALLAEGIDEGVLPLWPGGDPTPEILMANPSAALAAGLQLRPLDDTIRDTFAWARTNLDVAKGGLPLDRLHNVLARLRID
jgi:2'-hydroxyisoflavone reductase